MGRKLVAAFIASSAALLVLSGCGRSGIHEGFPPDAGPDEKPPPVPSRCAFADVTPADGFVETAPNYWLYVGRPEARGCAVYAPQLLIRTEGLNPAFWDVLYLVRVCNRCDDPHRLAWMLAVEQYVHITSSDVLRLNGFPEADYGLLGEGPPITVAIRDAAGTTVPDACGWPHSPDCDPAGVPHPANHELVLRPGETALIEGLNSIVGRYTGAPIFFDWRPAWATDGGVVSPVYDYWGPQSLVFIVPQLQSMDGAPRAERPFENACASAGFPVATACGFVLPEADRALPAMEVIAPGVALPPPVLNALRTHAQQ